MTKASASASRPDRSTSGAPAAVKPGRSRRKSPDVPAAPGRARVIAIANQKGGVGKSTTAVSLGAALADVGYRVLVADLDPQGNASTGMGIRHDARDVTVYDVVVADAEIQQAIVPTPVERLHAVPATIDLAGAEIELVSQFSREARLKKAIQPIVEGMYDFILLDCPPSLGLLTINALTAAEELIVPIQCEYYALEGLGQLLRNVSLVQQNINSGLRLSGIVMTMFDPRTKLSDQVVQEVQRYFGDLVYRVIIPRTVRLSEAPGFGQPITVYDARSKGAEAYRQLALEVALRPPPSTPMPTFEDMPTVVIEPIRDVDSAPAGRDPELEPEEEPEPEPEPQPASGAASPSDEEGPVLERGPDVESDVGQPEAPSELAPAPVSVDVKGRSAEAAPAAAKRVERRENEAEAWHEAPPEPEPRVKPLSRPPPPGELPERRVVVIDEARDLDLGADRETPPRGSGLDTDRHGAADIGETLDSENAPKRRWRLFRKGGE